MLEGRKVTDLVGNEFVNAIFTAQFQIDINHSLPPKPLALPTCARVSSLWGELSLDLCWLSPDNENILFSIKQSGMFPGSVPRLPRAVVTVAVTNWLSSVQIMSPGRRNTSNYSAGFTPRQQ